MSDSTIIMSKKCRFTHLKTRQVIGLTARSEWDIFVSSAEDHSAENLIETATRTKVVIND